MKRSEFLPVLRKAAVSVTLAAALTAGLAFSAGAATKTPTPTAKTESVSPTVAATPTPGIGDPSLYVTNAVKGWPKAREDTANAAGLCVMDADTGAVLVGKNLEQALAPASVTKVMTCYMALKYGNLDDQVTMTQEAVDYAIAGSSNFDTRVGETFTLRDMLYCMMLKSANDIATQVGIYVGGGSLDHFYDMENEELAAMGCVNSHFHSACGMPDDSHYTCAYDLALISKAALQYDLFRTIVGTKTYTMPATNMHEARTVENHHPLLNGEVNVKCDGLIGGKTGYTDAAACVLSTYCERDGRTMIVISMHGSAHDLEAEDAVSYFNYAYKNFKDAQPAGSTSVISGGTVTIPKDASVYDLDLTQTAETDPTYGDVVQNAFTYNGQAVGSSVMTASDAQTFADSFNTKTEDEKKQESESAAAESAASAGSEGILQKFVSSGKYSGENLLLLILTVLIVIGVIAILVSLVHRAKGGRKPVENEQPAPKSNAPATPVSTAGGSQTIGGRPVQEPEKAVKTDSEAKPEETEKTESEAKPEETEKPESETKPAETEKTESEAKPEETEKTESEAKPEETEKTESEAKPEETEKTDSEAKPEEAEKTESESKTENTDPAATKPKEAEQKAEVSEDKK
ncbi:MAG: hypothetical protein ACI4D6_10015 [Chordicoccus sp.]